jgi:hypothetical protein
MALDGATHLFFWHTIEAEVDVGTRAWDGGLLELSLDGGPFEPIAPVEPYPYRIIRNAAGPLAERDAFSAPSPSSKRSSSTRAARRVRAAALPLRLGRLDPPAGVGDRRHTVVAGRAVCRHLPRPGGERGQAGAGALRAGGVLPGILYAGRGFMVYRQAVS